MIKTFSALLLIIAIGYAWYQINFKKVLLPCVEPIKYAIGSFDRRFDLSHTDFLSALSEAEAIWEKSLGRELFSYAPEVGELKINLIYDYRQEVTEELSEIQGEVKEDEALYRFLQSQYAALKRE